VTAVVMTGAMELRALSVRLKAAGLEGQGLRRKLYKQMNDSVKPLAEKVADVEHLKPYMPDRYAAVLAEDLGVRITKAYSANPRIEVLAKARQHKRKVVMLDAGRINHPIFAQGPRRGWSWSNAQTGGMKAGFFSDVVKDESPRIRDQVLKAMTETAREVTGKI
jgi:hypothetical protein